jgi:uncharacterized protein YuzE
MKLRYNQAADALYVRFSNDPVTDSEETQPGVVFDFDAEGRIVAIELLDARSKLAPAAIQDLMAAQ